MGKVHFIRPGASDKAFEALVSQLAEEAIQKAGFRDDQTRGPGGKWVDEPGVNEPKVSENYADDLFSGPEHDDLLSFDTSPYQLAYEEWETWQGSKNIRQAAAEIADLDELHADPHIDSPPPHDTSYMPSDQELLENYARLYMDGTVRGEKFRYLARAVDTSTYLSDAEAEFWSNIAEGDEFDAPLLAFLSEDPVVGETNLLEKFGDDVLLEVTNAYGTDSGRLFSAPFWTEDDEARWLNDLSVESGTWLEGESREEFDRLINSPSRQDKRWAIESLGLDPDDPDWSRWAGSNLPESHEDYYEWYGNPYQEGSPREVISGGRFRVVEVKEDPTGTFGKIVELEQIGAYDPQNDGEYVAHE